MSASPAFQQALGLAVKARREELGLTQERLATHRSAPALGLKRRDRQAQPQLRKPRRLAAGLGLTASELIARAEQIEAGGIQPVDAAAR